MLDHKFKFGLSGLLFTMVILSVAIVSASSFTPPSNATVTMYRLNANGTIWVNPDTGSPTLCFAQSIVFGCTAFENNVNYPYPYENDNPVSVPIETDYLLDVIAQEMGSLEFHPNARHAQAIVARTFAYFHEEFSDVSLDNSINSQVFIPYRFEKWENESNFSPNYYDPCYTWDYNLLPQQKRICNAVNASRNYVTDGVPGVLPDDTLPARTEYFADVRDNTLTNPSTVGGQPLYPYLKGVPEPISNQLPPGYLDGQGYGMSQGGASRWGYGNLGKQGNLNNWSVQGYSTEQILVHYYTGIHIRDRWGYLVVPPERWNPLDINWGTSDDRPPNMLYGNSYPITIQVQNTSTQDWNCSTPNETYVLQYRWTHNGNDTAGSNQVSVCGINRGEAATLNLAIQNIPNWGSGTYGIHFDIAAANGSFRFSDQGWPTYTVLVCVGNEPCGGVFLPIVIKSE